MAKKKREPTFIFHIQIGDRELVNMDSLTQTEKEEIGKRLCRNLVLALGYEEAKT